MRPTRDDTHEWDLPHLADTLPLKPNDKYWLYDAKFYPYTTAGNDPIFAIASIRHALVYRISQEGDQGIQLIQSVEDEDKNVCTSSLAWSKDLKTGAPLLCVAGSNAKINIRDARTGALRMTLIGHGGDVNDLAVSPTNPEILASASADNTIRIWSINPAHKKQPCAVLCAGEGHIDTVLSVAFHGTGRYILSGGQDHVVNLWTIPEVPYDYIESQQPTVVHFPHFSTSEVHSNIVDCVSFHGDLILSKAFNEHCIVLWQITGFDSSAILTDPASAPANHSNKRGTRSAFSGSSETTIGSKHLCSRISAGIAHPILAICNSRSKVLFWDLSRLEEYHKLTTSNNNPNQNEFQESYAPPTWLASTRANDKKHESLSACQGSEAKTTRASLSSIPPPSPGLLLGSSAEPLASAKRRYDMDDPLKMLEAHKVVTVPKLRVDGRQVAWSVCGKWCVVAASPNVILVLKR